MTYPSPTTGERVGMSFLTPRTPTDVALRREMMKQWANYSGGMMGRTPDYCNSSIHGLRLRPGLLRRERSALRRECAQLLRVHPRARSLPDAHADQPAGEPREGASTSRRTRICPPGSSRRTSDGVVIRGCRMLATSAPLADEIMVFPSTVVKNENADKYAFAFAIPTDTPGMKFICRESLDQGRVALRPPARLALRGDGRDRRLR